MTFGAKHAAVLERGLTAHSVRKIVVVMNMTRAQHAATGTLTSAIAVHPSLELDLLGELTSH
jgi:hypothetical protein